MFLGENIYSEALSPTRIQSSFCSDYDNNYPCNQRVGKLVHSVYLYLQQHISIVLRPLLTFHRIVFYYIVKDRRRFVQKASSFRAMHHLLPSVNISHVNFLNVVVVAFYKNLMAVKLTTF